MALGLIAPQVDVSLLMPSISQQSRSGAGDVSLQDAEVDANTSMYSMPGMFLLFILIYKVNIYSEIFFKNLPNLNV
jgi:hypothetical protein